MKDSVITGGIFCVKLVSCQRIGVAKLSLDMTVLKLIHVLALSLLSLLLTAQESDNVSVRSVIAEYRTLLKSGRLKEGVDRLSGLLKSNIPLTPKEKLGINNNLGILNKNLGQYEVALRFYDEAETIYLNNNFIDNSLLVSIYGNKVNIYSIKGDFKKALEYCEKAIRFVNASKGTASFKPQLASSLYLNAGIIYYNLNDFSQSLSAFQKSILLKDKYNLPGKDFVYKHFANIYAKIGKNLIADKYFNLSIKHSEGEANEYSNDLVNIYLEYGNFLISVHKIAEAFNPIQKALNISLKHFEEKNYLTSNCYQLMGDYYMITKDFPSALKYYQKTLVSGSYNFNDQRIEANPSLEGISLNLWQLRVLQRKADALMLLADQEKELKSKINLLKLSLNTIDLAVEMTNSIRVDYENEETRLIFTEKQKSVFVGAVETALKLYDLTGERRFLYLAYQTSQQSKANELKYEIARNISYSTQEIPDSLRKIEKEIKSEIAAYSALIRNESIKPMVDTAKISYWKDQQFDLSRRLDKTVETMDRNYPQFADKLKKGNIIPIETIQANLKQEDNLIDYIFSGKDAKGDRKLYEFVITPKEIVCHTELIDSTMSAELTGLKEQLISEFAQKSGINNYNLMNERLFKAYTVLIKPIEKYFIGKQLIIIPDDEISYLPFDAFLTLWVPTKHINYAELAFLIRNYSISYAYSTNTLWNAQSKAEFCPRVIGFAPDYSNGESGSKTAYKKLKNNNIEIENILNNFDGSLLKGGKATIAGFRANLNRGAVLHLAMHAELDTLQTGSSGLIFNAEPKNSGNSRLYNYEIGQMSIHSPMVVLSACNTGNGKLYGGEGLMSPCQKLRPCRCSCCS